MVEVSNKVSAEIVIDLNITVVKCFNSILLLILIFRGAEEACHNICICSRE